MPFVDAVSDIQREDVNILNPCKLVGPKFLRCYRLAYDSIQIAIAPLNAIFSRTVALDKLALERVTFSEDGHLDDLFGFFKVKELKMGNTNVRAIAHDAFSSSAFEMTSIDLKGNRLNDEGRVFDFLQKFVNLEKIDLSNNQLTYIPSGSFGKMARLQSINLQNNAIRLIQKHAFALPLGSQIYRSLNIDMQSNELTGSSFEPEFVFARETMKVVMNLERNKIQTLEEDLFKSVFERAANKNSIILNENPIQCTNTLRELLRKYFVEFEDCGEDFRFV